MRKSKQLPFLFLAVLLLTACKLSTPVEEIKQKTALEGLNLSSREWTAAQKEDVIASTVKVSRLDTDVYKMTFSIDYATLDAGSVGYNGSNMGYFMMCAASHIATKAAQPYFWTGHLDGERPFEGKTPKTPAVVYLGLSDVSSSKPPATQQKIIWDKVGVSDPKTLKPICQSVFANYPN